MGHRLPRPRERSRSRGHESLEDFFARREFHPRLRSKWKRLHPAHGVGKHARLNRHQVACGTAISGCPSKDLSWDAAVLSTLSCEGPPLSPREFAGDAPFAIPFSPPPAPTPPPHLANPPPPRPPPTQRH